MKETIKLTVRLFLITAIAGFVLAFANSFTSPVIKERERLQYEEALREVFADADKFETLEDGKLNSIKTKIKNIEKVEIAKKSDKTVGYVFKTLGKNGYGGDISMLMAINNENQTIVGFKVLKHSETPGLGSRVTTDEYAKSVIGNTVKEHLVKNLNPEADNDIQAITGTTISVNAVLNGLNAAIDALQEVGK
ncbi:MAG: RnfABCDGE type electron transport complex subunit G [Peptoniphilaceae bacterium]|uniref:RnfABCDGE type electron transport complex subunit G n=1 Tax=Parvimonas sp. TaxID=1944660 RepID=UPI0025EC5B7D|nr:RnfABCDGE type electron transport complex subunit G [Parvimonas sp.]MCI5997462.1 RnfABCDGE type electron transport complex subunit G [Parvimonas sp.]MDD7764176.1 RnfABCDGE type electron transport complex subunit G [Peptoniphilaceae bacterium]MDY3050381.1 RnfABCDGE type electron transport complex subunit G [Parvimonas sp.]